MRLSPNCPDRPPLHLQPYSSHEFQSIALLNHARPEAVIKNHFAVFEMVLEVNVGGLGSEGFGHLS